MKLSEIKGEAAIEALADIIEPASVIFSDPEIQKLAVKNGSKMPVVKKLLKSYKKEVTEILTILDGGQEPNVLTVPVKLLEVFNDKELQELFGYQATNN